MLNKLNLKSTIQQHICIFRVMNLKWTLNPCDAILCLVPLNWHKLVWIGSNHFLATDVKH